MENATKTKLSGPNIYTQIQYMNIIARKGVERAHPKKQESNCRNRRKLRRENRFLPAFSKIKEIKTPVKTPERHNTWA